jgi:hypothetical protein
MNARIHLTLACAALALACPAQQRDWVQMKPTIAPTAREGVAMVYDTARDRVVLFGGRYLGDTWEWDGAAWALVKKYDGKTTPPRLSYHSMAYDSVRHRTVLFGGYGIDDATQGLRYFGDTWEWDGVSWTKVPTTVAPSARGWFAMAYDVDRRKTVLFGGYDMYRAPIHYDDTWEWDGAQWTKAVTPVSPQGRWGHAMAYDVDHKRTVLFGGNDGADYTNDTWEWDGAQWVEIDTGPRPPARGWHGMAYDTIGKRTILFGGFDGKTTLPTTLDYYAFPNGTGRWMQVAPKTQPDGRGGHAFVYDPVRRCAFAFGGWCPTGASAETWVLGAAAAFSAYGRGCGTPPVRLESNDRPIIGGDLRLITSELPGGTTTALMTIGLSNRSYGGMVLPLPLDAIGFSGCYLYDSLDAILPFPVQNGTGEFVAKIPYDMGLLGYRLYFQSTAGTVTSNGGEVLFGNL